ncbi:MAG TPA: PRC-barrel domain-containing protein [Longimicrobiales bacterium]|nr:PRC-barrel domain-containing protein [Longimicrobiales bacterium]
MTESDECRPDDERPEPLQPVPDLAGTPAADAHGTYFGEVFGTLAEPGSGLIRYLDVDVHGTDRHVLVPIGHARIQRHGEVPEVRLRAATRADLETIPTFEPDAPLDDIFEGQVLAAHCRLFAGARYYAHPAYDHGGLYAGEHPIVAPAIAVPQAALTPLSQLPGFRVAEGEPDVRGWRVVDCRGDEVGVIDDLVVDPAARKVRYALARIEGGAPLLLPVGLLALDAEAARVRVAGLSGEDLGTLPPAPSDAITRAAEDELRVALDARLQGARRFDRPDFRCPPVSDQ